VIFSIAKHRSSCFLIALFSPSLASNLGAPNSGDRASCNKRFKRGYVSMVSVETYLAVLTIAYTYHCVGLPLRRLIIASLFIRVAYAPATMMLPDAIDPQDTAQRLHAHAIHISRLPERTPAHAVLFTRSRLCIQSQV
jgi:hypothetical protein